MKTALYAGSFDPFTYGHKDIVLSALCVFDKVIISIGENKKKTRTLGTVESMNVIASYFPPDYIGRRVEIDTFTGSIVEYAKRLEVDALVRGMRQVSDFNDEFTFNGIVAPEIKIPITYFICDTVYLHVSSSNAREMHSLGMNVNWLINDRAQSELKKLANK